MQSSENRKEVLTRTGPSLRERVREILCHPIQLETRDVQVRDRDLIVLRWVANTHIFHKHQLLLVPENLLQPSGIDVAVWWHVHLTKEMMVKISKRLLTAAP